MARPPSFTPEEDRIILDTANQESVVTNRMLAEAGFRQRTPTSIISRRKYLVRNGAATGKSDLVALRARRERLLARYSEVRRELEQVNASIRSELVKVERSLDLDLAERDERPIG